MLSDKKDSGPLLSVAALALPHNAGDYRTSLSYLPPTPITKKDHATTERTQHKEKTKSDKITVVKTDGTFL